MLSRASQELFEAIDEVNLQKFEKALEDGADVNALENDENTPLEDGADVNALKNHGTTPLMNIISAWAADGKNDRTYRVMANLLITNQNININIQNRKQRNTALHIAIALKLTEPVKLLLTCKRIDFSIKNDYPCDDDPYTINRYNDTALEYANKLSTPEIAKEIEKEIYRRSTFYYQAKSLLKRAKPYIAKALIAAALSAVLIYIVLESRILHRSIDIVLESRILYTPLILYIIIAIIFHTCLLSIFIFNGVSINSPSYDKRAVLFWGLSSLYCFGLFADIIAGEGYFFISQLLFSFGTPLLLFQEVRAIGCYIIDICKSSEAIPYLILAFAIEFLFICLIRCVINRLLDQGDYAGAQAHEPLSHAEFMRIRRARAESLNDMHLEPLRNVNIDTSLRNIQLELLRDINAENPAAILRDINIENPVMRERANF